MQKPDYVSIGNRIRQVRKAQGLTQESAAEKCDITSAYYGNIERGDKKMSIETLVKVSVGLGISTDTLLFGESEDKDSMILFWENIQRTVDKGQIDKYFKIMDAVAGVMKEF